MILGVALWLRHDPQTTSLLYLELGNKPAPNTFYVGEYQGDGFQSQCRTVREGFQEEADGPNLVGEALELGVA